jgi:THAP4-like, heme-binding beta-barrel domain
VPLEIDPTLPASLVPLSWLVGRWEGAGVLASAEAGEAQVGQEVDIAADARGFLAYRSQLWRLDPDGARTEPLDTETGFWRTAVEQSTPGRPGVDVELLLAHPTGVVEVFVGRTQGTRVELVTDAVVRTSGGPDYTAARRTYGQVEGDLLWVQDVASSTEPLHARLSARLKRVPGAA